MHDLLAALQPIIITLIAGLLTIGIRYLARWVNLNVSQAQLETLATAIWQYILDVEKSHSDKSGTIKKAAVVQRVEDAFRDPANMVFSAARQTIMTRLFGTAQFVPMLVEKAFQMFHLANKHPPQR